MYRKYQRQVAELLALLTDDDLESVMALEVEPKFEKQIRGEISKEKNRQEGAASLRKFVFDYNSEEGLLYVRSIAVILHHRFYKKPYSAGDL